MSNNRNFSTQSANLQEIEFVRLTPHDLRAMKESVLNLVSAALIQRPGASVTDPTLMKISEIVSQVAFYDPEFVLKLAVYVRLDLNIRTTANYLFALACNIDECRPYVRKYFCDGIRLPSDWIDVAATYRVLPGKKLKGKSIPSCLRKSMTDKFSQFDSYQLGKYNNEKTVKRKLKKQREEREKNPERSQSNAKPLITIKQMIRDLHINEPVFPVMSILGKKYPANDREFRTSGLSGSFEPEKAGMRMKLPTPETWETLLSEKGNRASTWEELIEHKKLPFMAMLRNIRNLIYTGVHPKYHRWVQNKLSNQNTIANSKQFPFSFFSAYEVIPKDLEHFKELTSGDSTTGMRRKNRKPVVIAHMPQTNVFDDYRNALDQAVKLSTVYNCQPISGSVSVLCNVSQNSQQEAPGAKNMGSKIRNIAEIGYLLGLMAKYVCEDCDFRVYSSPSDLNPNTSHLPVELSEGTILDNMKLVAEVADKLGPQDNGFPYEYVEDLIRDKKRVNCLMVLSHTSIPPHEISNLLKKYRELVNPDLLFVSVDLSGSGRTTLGADEAHPNDIVITGFSDQILRFIAERGDETQLQYVEHIDIAKKIGIKDIQEISLISPWWKWLDTLGQSELSFPNITKSAPMKQMRIFISSTFLDMHGERDYISGVVIPELKFKAKQRKIDIVEVDLRWGLTEEDSQHGNTLSLCLDSVENCLPFFVGILGERYGWAPEDYQVPNDVRFNWVRNYPNGRSITELEIHRALQRENYEFSEASFFYFRDNSFINSLPQDAKVNFMCEDEERAVKMENLKNKIRESGRPVFEDYPCNFGGVTDEKAVTADLEQFGERMFNDLWSALDENFPEKERPVEVNHLLEERSFHQSFATELSTKFFGRTDELKQLGHFVSGQTDNLLIVVGESGDGKSSLLSKFAIDAADKDSHTFYLSHFIGASPGSVDIRITVSRLCHELVNAFDLDVVVPEDYKELCLLLPEVLEQASFQGKLVLILDGIDQLDSKNRAHSMEWLPKQFPCKIILSSTPGSDCISALDSRSQPYRVLTFKPMKAGERKHIVRELLARYNKKLDERPMNLQMRVLLRKTDSSSPLYLTVACEELRLHGVYELVTERIRKLSMKLSGLFAEIIIRLENDHTAELVKNALSLICYSRNGVLESEIQEILQVEDEKWLRLFRALSSYLIVSEETGEIKFFHRYFTEAVAKRYYTNLHQQSIHTKLAQYFYTCLDVHHDFSWETESDMINDRAIRELPYHLISGKQWKLLVSVLTDLNFIEMKMMLGFSYGLIDDYASATASDLDEYDDKDLVRNFREFVKSNRHILHENPDLTFQQAANLPNHSSPAQKAQSDFVKGSSPDSWLKWLNKTTKNDPCKMTLSGFSDGVTSSCYSPYGDTFALAFRDCSIKIFESETGNEISTMLGHSNWITSIKFSPDGSLLASVSWDQSAIVWDVRSATVISVFKEHSRRINTCCFSHSGNILATGAWDCTVKLWDVATTNNNRSIRTVLCGERPINEISFSPDDSLIIAATWDGTVAFIDISDYDKSHVSRVLGHQKSIKTIEFSPSGKHFVTGSMDKSVILWDANARKPITTLSKHSKPVTSVTYSRDGDYLSSASIDGTVKVWDANLGSEIHSFRYSDHSHTQQCASFHPTNTSILATGCSDCSILIWNWQNGTLIAKLEGHHRAPHTLEYSPCGTLIASAAEDGKVLVWDSQTYQQKYCFEEHRGTHLGGISWSPQLGDLRLATCAQSIIIWDISTGTIANRIEPEDKSLIAAVSFDSKGKLIVSAAKDKSLRIWDSRNGNEIQVLRGHGDWVNSCHFQGNKVVSCSFDYSIRLWNAKNAKFTEMHGHSSAVNFVRFNPDGNTFVSCSSDETLKIWDSYSCTEITTLVGHNGRVNSCCYSADGKLIASVSDDGFIKVWSPLESTEIETLIGHSGPVRNANFGSKNEIITSSDDRSARIWDLGITKQEEMYGSSFTKQVVEHEVEKQGLTGHSARINDIRINEDGTFLITASDDGSCRAWDLNTMKMVRVFTDPKERPYVGCDINGTTIAMVTDTSFVTVWDIITGQKLHSENAFSQGRPATCLRLTSDGREVVVGGWTSQIKKMKIGYDSYNTSTFDQVHTDWITCIATNGSHFVSGGWDEIMGVYSDQGRSITSIAVHDSTITDCAISDNDLFIATTSTSGDIVLLSTRTFQKVGEMWNRCKANCISFGTDRKKTTLYTGGEDGYINVWDVNGKILNKFVCHAPVTSIHARKIGHDNFIVAGDQIGNLYYIKQE